MSRAPRIPQTAALLVALLGGAAGPALAQPGPRVLDRVVAVVRPDPRERLQEGARESLITLSDLRFEAAVALISGGAIAAASAPLQEEGLASALDYAISQRLHVQEAERLRAFTVQPAELEASLRDLVARLGGAEALERFLARHERSPADLGRVLERNLRAARTLDSKVRLRAQVSESEIRRAYDDDPSQHAWPYEERRGLLREMIFRKRYQQLAGEETRQLRQRADVRVLVPWSTEAQEGA